MSDTPEEPALPPSLRFLKALVIVLTITMIVGVITVVGLLVTRMPKAPPPMPVLPDQLVLPDGASAVAVTTAAGWIGVVTNDNRFLVFTPDGTLRQTVTLAPLPKP